MQSWFWPQWLIAILFLFNTILAIVMNGKQGWWKACRLDALLSEFDR